MLKHLAPRVANWPPKFADGILFPDLGPIQGHKVQHLLVTLGRLNFYFFSSSALTPSVTLNPKPWGLISTFAPIGMLDFELNIGPDS